MKLIKANKQFMYSYNTYSSEGSYDAHGSIDSQLSTFYTKNGDSDGLYNDQ